MKIHISLFAATFAATTKAQDAATLIDVVTSTPDLSTLGTAIGLAGMEEFLTTSPSLTFFAPNNAALESLPKNFLTPNFAVHLRSILEIHLVEGAVTSGNITDFAAFDAVSGDMIIATVNDEGTFFSGDVFSGSQLVTPDLMAGNSIIHIVNQYFLPLSLSYDLYDLSTSLSGFDQIRKLITEAGLEDELRQDNRTILAPSDQAFDLLSDDLVNEVANNPGFRDDLVLYHIIIGSYPSSLITDGMVAMTALGVTMNFTVVEDAGVKTFIAVGPLNQVGLQAGDLIALNGMGHSLGGVLEVPVRTPPFVNQTSSAPNAAPSGNTGGDVPTSEPVELVSDAPMTASPVIGGSPVQTSSAPVFCTSLIVLLSSVLGFH